MRVINRVGLPLTWCAEDTFGGFEGIPRAFDKGDLELKLFAI